MKTELASEPIDDITQESWEKVEFYLLDIFRIPYLSPKKILLRVFFLGGGVKSSSISSFCVFDGANCSILEN